MRQQSTGEVEKLRKSIRPEFLNYTWQPAGISFSEYLRPAEKYSRILAKKGA
jgi:hypothetical protein